MVRSSSRWAKVAVLALLALKPVVSLAAVAHTDEHPHTFCSEHQTFEERAVKAAPSTDGINGGTAQAHELCPFVELWAPVPAVPPITNDSDPAPNQLALQSRRISPGYVPLAVLARAPKGSPPYSALS